MDHIEKMKKKNRRNVYIIIAMLVAVFVVGFVCLFVRFYIYPALLVAVASV